LKVKAAQTPELSALGAVFQGCIGLKIFNSLDDLAILPFGATEYTPALDSARANQLFAGWQTAVQQVLCYPKQG
jgi:glycerol kinase